MRLKEVYIKKYGPLLDRSCTFSGGFNLITGDNEYGKTLTIDAMVKLLLLKVKKEGSNFEQLDRVDETPEGYVLLLKDGEEFKLPEQGRLTELAGLTPLEWGNLFIIRNSDLSIPKEDGFYTRITDRLTGLRSLEISKITDRLNEAARLTKTGRYFNNTEANKFLKDRLDRGALIIAEVNELQRLAPARGYDRLEVELAEIEAAKELMANELQSLDDARKREKYEKVAGAQQTLSQNMEQYARVAVFNGEDLECWSYNEREGVRLESAVRQHNAELGENALELELIAEELAEKEKELDLLERRHTDIENNIDANINECRRRRGELRHREEKERRLLPLACIATALLAISLPGALFNPYWYSLLLSGIFFLIATVLWWPRVILARERGSLARLMEKINLSLAPYSMQGDDLTDILAKLRAFKEKYASVKNDVNRLSNEKARLADKVGELEQTMIPRLQQQQHEALAAIEKIKRASGAAILQEYRDRLDEKNKLEQGMEQQRSILRSLTGVGDTDPETDLQCWEQKVRELAIHQGKATGTFWDEQKAGALKENSKELENAGENLRKELAAFKEQLSVLERKTNEVLQPEEGYEFLPCRSFVDLETIKGKLQSFIDECTYKKDGAFVAIDIFKEIDEEEKEKVSELFGEGSDVSAYMSQITSGLYSSVLFDGSTVLCRCERGDDLIDLKPDKLSGGAYDQLYFSVRLALGERLFKGEKGFFIMDDPFIKADAKRLRCQLEALLQVAATGWQIIYFSAKQEVKEALAGEIENGIVRYQEMLLSLL